MPHTLQEDGFQIVPSVLAETEVETLRVVLNSLHAAGFCFPNVGRCDGALRQCRAPLSIGTFTYI
jgi:hypothetical protein